MRSSIKKDNLKKELESKDSILACAREFNMVGDPTRLKICYLLCRHKELSVGDIAEVIGVSISAVSHTLRKLKKADMVESRREFRTVYYKLKKSPVVEVIKDRINHYENI
ncbi:MAG: metalloregulator ArsR/SmtB family transcription factor [Patescibacteria group bacterium]|nr:metalloregulator ArsR/SmtB family transcription factor [Patescibacteria group bacterium]